MIGKTILHYKILEKLGEGGKDEVFKAQDTKLDRFVALKFLPSQLTTSESDKARFIQEAKAASSMNHPNVCTIYDILESNGQLFIVMEIVDSIGQPQTYISWPALSPDGSKLIISGNDNDQNGIWMYDLNQKTPKTLILNGSVSHAIFTKDGKSIYYDSEQNGVSLIYKFNLNGLGEPERINHLEVDQFSPSLSVSNKYVLFSSRRKTSGIVDIYYQETVSNEVKALSKTDAAELFNMLSPDEKYMVFMSNKSGRFEIYVTSFPEMGLQRQVSTSGGVNSMWVGQYIYYENFDSEIMAVLIYIYGDEISISSPKTLLSGNQLGMLWGTPREGEKYTVSPDGQKIIAVRGTAINTVFYGIGGKLVGRV